MDSLCHLLAGFAAALSWQYLLYALAGCTLGTLIGVLPGLGPAAGTAILIPLTFSLDPTGAIIMLSAIYYGAMYGGTITSVLINVPGEAASVVTCIDGTLATVALVVVAMPLASLALKFGPAEFFALMVAGLCLVVGLAGRNIVAALLMTVIGLLLAMSGLDPVRGAPRFTFGIEELFDGIGFVPVVMGLFGVAELLLAAETRQTHMIEAELKSWMPTRQECKDCVGAILRGTGVG